MDAGNVALTAVIVEDERLAQDALAQYLERGGIKVIHIAASGRDGIDAVARLAPKVVLVDLGLPDIPGIEVTREIKAAAPAAQVLVVTTSAAQTDIIGAFESGATGYILKGAPPEEITAAAKATAFGEPVISRVIAAELVEAIKERRFRPRDSSLAAVYSGLSEREIEILRLIAAGKENSEIALELHVSPHTIKNHVANILAKLHLDNRIQAAVHAVRSGLA